MSIWKLNVAGALTHVFNAEKFKLARKEVEFAGS
jgi:hypothetical protein